MRKLEPKIKKLMGVGLFLAGLAVAYNMGQSNRLADDKVDLIGQAEAAGGVVQEVQSRGSGLATRNVQDDAEHAEQVSNLQFRPT